MSIPIEPSWDLFGAFLAVMQTGSLSGASRSLRVAQPTVRRQIEALEEALGATLFTRAPNGLTPTDLAQATLPHAEAIAASARALVRAASAPADADRGTVRVTCSEIIGAEVLPAMLVRLRHAHPEIQIELVLDNRNQDLLRREADVAIRMTAPTQTGLVRQRAGTIEIGLFASEAYVAKHSVPKTVAEAKKDHALIGPDRSRFALEVLASIGLPVTSRDFALRTDSDIAQLAAVRAGLGIGVCQVPIARGLVRVLPQVRFPLDAWVVTHEDLKGVRRVRTVVDHLTTELARYAQPIGSPTPRPSVRGRSPLPSGRSVSEHSSRAQPESGAKSRRKTPKGA